MTERPNASDVSGDSAPLAAAPWVAQRFVTKLVISLGLGGLFAWLSARGGVPLWPSAAQLSNVEPWTIPVYLGSLLLVHYFRASRWRFLIAPVQRVPLLDVLILNWIGFFAIFALPLRLGEFARPTLTKARRGIPISVGLGTVAVERVIDGLITSLCVAVALLWLPRIATRDPVARVIPTYGYAALLVFGAAFAALGMFLWQRKFALAITRMTVGLVSRRLADTLASKVDNVATGLRSIADARLALGFLFESVLYWGFNALGVWALGIGCGLPFHFGHALAVMGVLALGILLPAGPGLFGNFQLAVSAALHLYFVNALVETHGTAFIFLLYALQSLVMVVAGIVPLYALKLRLRDLVVASDRARVSTPD